MLQKETKIQRARPVTEEIIIKLFMEDGHGVQIFTHSIIGNLAMHLLIKCSRLSVCLRTVLRILLFLSWT